VLKGGHRMNKIYLDLLNVKTKKTFRKYFETEKAKNIQIKLWFWECKNYIIKE